MAKDDRKRAMVVIVLLGLVSLFSDTIYEGARSVNGPYLALLGANATLVGIIAGAGEFVGYGVRVISGYFSDKTRSYWLFTFIGYGLLISVPMIALSGIWQIAALFMVFERFGKALRSPSKDTILSMVSNRVGRGYGFGLHEAMDQLGAFIGPMIFTAIFSIYAISSGNELRLYQKGYGLLLIPFFIVMTLLVFSRSLVPDPAKFEDVKEHEEKSDSFTKVFWLYSLFTFFSTTGFAVFTLIAYHLKVNSIVSDSLIPAFYAGAMIVDGIAALIVGKLYDKKGLNLLVLTPIITAPIAFTVFSKNIILIVIGVLFWGIVMGIHETIMKAAIADLTHINKRGLGYGLFNAIYGVSMLIGGGVMGFLYDSGNIILVGAFSLSMEIIAMIIFFYFFKKSFNFE